MGSLYNLWLKTQQDMLEKKSQKLVSKPPVPKPKNPAFENPGPSLIENNMYIVLCAYIL